MQVIDILRRIGYTSFTESSTHYHTTPLYRDSNNPSALEIDKTTGCWYDFVERRGGSIFSLAMLTKGLKNKEEVKKFLETETLEVDTNIQHRCELGEIKKFDRNLLVKLRRDHGYWLNRGISTSTIELFEGGITFNGRMSNRYVFPIFNGQNELIGFSGRLLTNDSRYPKWKHIGAKTNWCYPSKWNELILARLRKVILVESIGDMLALWDAGIKNTLVTFGLNIGSRVIELMLKMDAQQIFVAFNNDAENNMVGNEAADEAKQYLGSYFDDSQITVAIPDFKDFGEMTTEQIGIWKTKFQTS